MTEEIWKDIPRFEGWYQVSNTGVVRSLDRYIVDGRLIKGKILNQYSDRQNYKKVALCRSGKHYKNFVHRLVAEAFVPNPNNLPVINHIDENPENNYADNLEWCSVKYNVNYGDRAKKYAEKTQGELHYMHKLTEDNVRQIKSEYKRGVKGCGMEYLGKKYGVHRMTIKAILIGQTWKHIKEVNTYDS